MRERAPSLQPPAVAEYAAAALAEGLPFDGPRRRALRRLVRDRGVVVGVLVLVGVGVAAAAAPLLAPFAPNAPHFTATLRGPGSTYLLGADNLGRDELSRLLVGARLSLGSVVV